MGTRVPDAGRVRDGGTEVTRHQGREQLWRGSGTFQPVRETKPNCKTLGFKTNPRASLLVSRLLCPRRR